MSPHPNKEESFLSRLTETTEANLSNERFGVSELAREMGMSRSNLHRKLKAVKGISISSFIRQIRLERAMELLKQSSLTISEIAFEVGFNSVTYFIKCFHDYYGYSPGELRKNESMDADTEDLNRKGTKKGIWKKQFSPAFLISLILIFITALLLIIVVKPFGTKDQPLDKSIAVLPFINDSPEETEMYFINGTMEAILNNLCKIEDLRVVSRNSVEQYRNNPKPTPVVAEEMNVSYILEGSGMKQGDRILFTLQLIDARNDKHIWSESYRRNTEEVFDLYSEVSQLVASEIEAIVTPEEKQLIEKIPTKSQTAWDLYLKGCEENPYLEPSTLGINIAAFQNMEELFRLALEYDPTFASLYSGIASVYNGKYKWEAENSENYLDTVRLYFEKALSYDDRLASAYLERGHYHQLLGEKEKAIDDYNKTLVLEPNNIEALISIAWLYYSLQDYKSTIEYLHKVELINRGPALIGNFGMLRDTYFRIGCYDQSNKYNKRILALNGDSVAYYISLAENEYFINYNTAEAIKLLKQGYAIAPENLNILGNLAEIYFDLGSYEEALWYAEKKIERLNGTNLADIYQAFIAGFIYKKNGNIEKADFYFNQQIRYCETRLNAEKYMHGQLAMAYCGKGEKEKVYENLRALNQMERGSVYILRSMQDNHYYECIQDEPEFQKIRSELIAKYKAEHERVMQWLEENDR